MLIKREGNDILIRIDAAHPDYLQLRALIGTQPPKKEYKDQPKAQRKNLSSKLGKIVFTKCGGEGGKPGPCPSGKTDPGPQSSLPNAKPENESKPIESTQPHNKEKYVPGKPDSEVSKVLKKGQEKAFVESLSADEAKSLWEYKGDDPYAPGAAIALNYDLREGRKLTQSQQTAVDNIDNAFMKAPRLKENTTLYKGTDGLMRTEKGYIISRGYTSTSVNKEKAEGFSGITGGEPYMYHITVPKGFPVLPTSHFHDWSSISEEAELVLPRNAVMKVIRTEGNTVYAEAVLSAYWMTKPPKYKGLLRSDNEQTTYKLKSRLRKPITKSVVKCGGEGGEPGPCPEGKTDPGPTDNLSKQTVYQLDATKLPVKLSATQEIASSRAHSILLKAQRLPSKIVDLGVSKAKAVYGKMEAKYGKKWATAIVAVGIVTFPTPFTTGAVLATIGMAKLSTKIFTKSIANTDLLLKRAQEFVDELTKEIAGIDLSPDDTQALEGMLEHLG